MAKRMSFFGVGPLLFLSGAVSAGVLFALHYRYAPVFAIQAGPRWLCPAIGLALLTAGAALSATAFAAVRGGFGRGELVTKGPYAHCRHPLYAAWIVLIIPGALAFFRSWILLGIPVAMYVTFRIVIRREEDRLVREFGDDYIRYRQSVNPMFPKLRGRN